MSHFSFFLSSVIKKNKFFYIYNLYKYAVYKILFYAIE